MDHRGPEHHYDEVECPECGTKWQQGEIQPETVRNNCPECDYDLRSGTGGRPYRGQPSPVQSEMTERNTPLDGVSEDRGGNPLGEGILSKSIIEEAQEEAEQKTSPTEPEGLGETNPVKDSDWKPGDITSRPARDEMLGSVRLAFEDSDKIWNEVVSEFENANNEFANEDDSTDKVASAPWLEDNNVDSNIPTEQLGWDIVEVVEPDREILEAQHKYSMPFPEGITDNLHNALVKLNVWVENPEENGQLRPYKEYWSVIRPKVNKDTTVQIGVESPHMADIINHIARTDDATALEKRSNFEKESWAFLAPLAGMAARALGGMALKSIAPRIAGPLLRGAISGGISNALGGKGGGGGGGQQAPAPQIPQTTAKVATYGDDYDHPSSITRRIEDPVNGGIDPHQRTDQSNDDWAYDMLDVNEIGSTNDPRGKDDAKERIKRQFASKEDDKLTKEQEKALEDLFKNIEKVMDFFNSEDSMLDDSELSPIYDQFNLAFPGCIDSAEMTPEAEEFVILLDEDKSNKKKSAYGDLDDQGEVVNNPNAGKTNQSQCSICEQEGRTTYVDPSMIGPQNPLGLCESHAGDKAEKGAMGPESAPMQVSNLPMNQVVDQTNQMKAEQDAMKQMGIGPAVASNEQGPHTDEQQAAVAELLIEQGREEEIPNMIENSYEYDEELAEIQNKQPMLDEAVEDQPGPAQEQPMPNQGMPPGMPPMGAPSPADLGAPGPAAGPAPGVMASMLKSAFKHGADSIAGKCPKCDSHTTKMIQQDGRCKCQTCGHSWKDDSFQAADGHSTDLSSTATYHYALDEIKSDHLDSFSEPEEELEIDDSTHKWVDENDQPLEEGKEYEIYAHDYDIPDVGRVVEIKPDAIVYEIESDGGLRTTIEIDRQEADQNGYRFVESGIGSSAENRPGIEENMDSKPVAVPGESSDLSTPHIQIGSSTKFSFEDYDEALVTEAIEWLLSLDGPYVFNEFEGMSQEEYEDEILNMHPDEILRAVDAHYGGGLDQLARDAGIVSQDDNPEEGLSAFAKTAGKHYTPMEQRELIDEYGEARNADKLNLENTHYAQSDDDYFLFGC